MKYTFLLGLVILIAFCDDSDAWWGRSKTSSRTSSSSRSSKSNSLQSKIKATVNRIRTKVNKAIQYPGQYIQGAKEMKKAYDEMRKANVIGSDKYFHAKANFNAAKHGPGGVQAAKDISNLREITDKARYKVDNWVGRISDDKYVRNAADSDKDREANEWGRSGGNPNKYRVKGIPPEYKK